MSRKAKPKAVEVDFVALKEDLTEAQALIGKERALNDLEARLKRISAAVDLLQL